MSQNILILSVFIFCIGVWLFFKYTRNTQLPEWQKNLFLQEMKKISVSISPTSQIINFDILYHSILRAIGYKGTFGEILKRNPKEISNINLIWKLHKIRNTLVHEIQIAKNNSLKSSCSEYKKEIEKLVKKC